MNGIDRVVEELEHMIKKGEEIFAANGDTAFLGDITILKNCLSLIRRECADLLGKPLVDARQMLNLPFSEQNCIMKDSNGLCQRTGNDCSLGKRPVDCPINWKERQV